MLALSITLALFFLLWAHFVATSTYALIRLGKTLSMGRHPRRFFYYPFHSLVCKKPSFNSILFTATLSQQLARLAYGGVIIFALFLFQEISWLAISITLLVALWLMLFIGDLFPRLLVQYRPEKALAHSILLTSFFLFISFPFTFLFFKIRDSISQKQPDDLGINPVEETKEIIVGILQDANMVGKLGASDKKLIESVVKFKDRIVREVMVPRVDLFSLPCETTLKEAAIHFLEEGYSRIPIYQESVDNITGVLMFKDFLKLYMDVVEGKSDLSFLNSSIAPLTKRVFYTPETKKASHLLQEFRAKQMHMAIVVDEYGGTEGVVTMEDILEEIVGEIADEYDFDENALYTSSPGGGWIVDARMSILDAEDAFNIHIPQEGDYDTIGGYIFHEVGSIPESGQKIHHENFTLEILSSNERSVDKVKLIARREESK
ncbi:MAG: hypothetical protein S4CHLAM45_09370 [Chlamydiales bacterium]|nr:hypothetical protein [Chlamydiales bacterium]MCH9620088.1 hypothetical protein [Chlamydiales bacterium]MCH9623041.1 hypothetical protein [Chlamydiales bacterium]